MRIESAHGDATHGLDARTDKDLTGVHLNRTGRVVNGLHGRTAEPVDRGTGNADRQACHQHHQAGHIESLLTFGKCTPENQIFDVVDVDAGSVYESPNNLCCQIVRPDLSQQALVGKVEW